MFVHLVHGIYILSPERDSANSPNTQTPPCQPPSIANMGAFEFSNIVCEQLQRIEHLFGSSYPDELLNEFEAFKEKYQCDCGFKSIF
jgi:hypothetical protein